MTAKFKVYRPNRDAFTAKYNPFEEPVGLVRNGNTEAIKFSAAFPGIEFKATVSVPNIPTSRGDVAFEQKRTLSERAVRRGIAPNTSYEHVLATNALDSEDEDPIYHLDGVPNPNVPTADVAYNFPVVDVGTSDRPELDFGDIYTGAKVDDSFTMYLMYKPRIAGSIWVAVGKVSWGWSALAEKDGGWSLTKHSPEVIKVDGQPDVRPTDPTTEDYFDIPEWDMHAEELLRETYTPAQPW